MSVVTDSSSEVRSVGCNIIFDGYESSEVVQNVGGGGGGCGGD